MSTSTIVILSFVFIASIVQAVLSRMTIDGLKAMGRQMANELDNMNNGHDLPTEVDNVVELTRMVTDTADELDGDPEYMVVSRLYISDLEIALDAMESLQRRHIYKS